VFSCVVWDKLNNSLDAKYEVKPLLQARIIFWLLVSKLAI
jgi:hypothetical protein